MMKMRGDTARSACHGRPGRADAPVALDAEHGRDGRGTRIPTARFAVAIAFVAIAITSPTHAQPAANPGTPTGDALLDTRTMQRVEASVDRALEYLARHQNPDGSWPSGLGRNNGINAVCLLAFLGRGHVPGRGPFQPVVDRAVAFMLATQDDMGMYRSPNPTHGPMYEHALATLALIEAYGAVSSAGTSAGASGGGGIAMRHNVQRAIDLIVKAQSDNGGWRYQPYPGDADLSVTVMIAVALRSAQNARLRVPNETVAKALRYVKACIVPEGGFAYQPYGAPGPARTAAGCLTMQLLGEFDHPAVEKGLRYIHQQGYTPTMEHFWYLNYYAMQAHFQAGGEYWANWHPKVRRFLLDAQKEDGSWPGFSDQRYNGATRCFSTAMAATTLEVYMHYLPAYQR